MGRKDHEHYARTILLLMEGGMFIAREILKRETQKHEGNLNDFLRSYREQLERRFTVRRFNEILPLVGGARPDDWNIVLLTGVLMEVFRTTLSSREKRELLVLRNVREELHTSIARPSLNEETFEDLKTQLVEALNSLATGLEPASVANCRKIINRYVYEPIHIPSSLEHLEDMCIVDEDFVAAVKTLREETRTIVDDILEIVNKAEDEGRTMKEAKVIEYNIKPECEHRELMECVETALIEATDDVADTEAPGEYARIRNDLEDMLNEIKQSGDVFAKYEKGTGMVLRIECKTYASLLEVLGFMESLQCMERLEMIATALKEHFGSQDRLVLVCSFTQENMEKLYEEIKTENVEYSRSISLSMRVNTIDGLAHVWDMFHDGGAQNHLNKIAEALSEYLGSKITLKASLDVTKFKQALEQAVGEPLEEMVKHSDAEKEAGKEENKEETKSAGESAEDEGQQANEATVSVPRRGVEIIAVKAGTRKRTLFDETISEGERDEITDMGFDIRDDARNRESVDNRQGPEEHAETVSENERTQEENTSDFSTQGTGQVTGDRNDKSVQADVEDSTGQPNAESPTGQRNAESPTGQANAESPTGQANAESPTGQANAESPTGQANVENSTGQDNAENSTGQDNAENSTDQSNANRSTAQVHPDHSTGTVRRVGHIPLEDIPDTVRGAVNSFYRDIVHMSSRTQEAHAGSEGAVSDATATEPVKEKPAGASASAATSTGVNRTREVRKSERPSSVKNQGKAGSKNMRETDQSVRLSLAVDAIGINEDVLDQQHERIQISESIMNQMAKLSRRHVTAHHFGSHAEGTSMIGLPSGLNTLIVLEDYSVIQNTFSLSQPSEFGHIILAEDTRPGFMRLPLTDEMCRDISNESSLLSAVESPETIGRLINEDRADESREGFGVETVLALRMAAWPLEIKRSLQQRSVAWAFDTSSDDLVNQPLMMVPCDSRDFRDDEMEWRICTAHVERVLMNSLNIHQRRVYILFRIILKYLVNPKLSKPLTSFMIKNIFLHMAAITWPDMWNEGNLVLCLNGCLSKTRQFLRANFIPNFFILKENLIHDGLSLSDRTRADEILLEASTRPYASIASIQDGNGGRLLDIPSSSRLLDRSRINTVDKVRTYLQTLNHGTCVQILTYKDFLLEWIVERSTDIKSAIEFHYEILNFLKNYTSGSENVRTSYLVASAASSFISTSLASHLVCLAFNTTDTVERDWLLSVAVIHFHRGMDSDALSSRMKFVTALIAMNHLTSAQEMMVDIELSSEVDARAVCACRRSSRIDYTYIPKKKTRLDKLMKSVCSCVVFLPSEIQITPVIMRYEMLRSPLTDAIQLQTSRCRKWAVADAKVYFGFLNTALYDTMADMEMYIDAKDVYHIETQMNFLGVFSELRGDLEKATEYFKKSLDHEPVHNAARWYLTLMLFRKWCRIRQAQSMIEY